MSLVLEQVVPWGRSYEEYVRMFNLSSHDLKGSILGCSDGPAAFNAEHTQRNGQIISVDPIYAFNATQIRTRIAATYDVVMTQVRQSAADFVWDDHIPSVEELGQTRMKAMEIFLNDFENGKSQGRYQTAELPSLPFADQIFDLSLCSHFLFLYSDHFDTAFHLQSIREMLRVSREVRIFPLLNLNGNPSPHLDVILHELPTYGVFCKIEKVSYQFQKGGNQMLVVKR